jgi:hypothetical protein
VRRRYRGRRIDEASLGELATLVTRSPVPVSRIVPRPNVRANYMNHRIYTKCSRNGLA